MTEAEHLEALDRAYRLGYRDAVADFDASLDVDACHIRAARKARKARAARASVVERYAASTEAA